MRELDLHELTDIIGEYVDLSGVDPTEDAVLGEDIPVDSRQMLRILSKLEARYRIRYAPSDVLSTRTLGDLLRLTRRRAGLT